MIRKIAYKHNAIIPSRKKFPIRVIYMDDEELTMVGTIHDSLNQFSIQNHLFWVNRESAIHFVKRINSF